MAGGNFVQTGRVSQVKTSRATASAEMGLQQVWHEGETEWGRLRVWASESGVTRVEWPRLGLAALNLTAGEGAEVAAEIAQQACEEIAAYLRGERTHFSVPLDWSGYTEFQGRVWAACCTLAYGQTCTYAELAARIGSPRAARAVGQALACNPTPILVPCHRVVASGTGLGGYSGGLQVKRRLLVLEGALGESPYVAQGPS